MLVAGFLFLFMSFLNIQVGAQGFSGSNINNYYCLSRQGATPPVQELNQNFVCVYPDGTQTNAIPKVPSSQQLQIWFVRVLYVIWAVAGIVFTFVLIGIGFNYLTSFGNEVALADVIKQFRKFIVGVALVVLAYPLLNTFFNVLGLRQSACFDTLQLPGFQFFFPQACVIEEE